MTRKEEILKKACEFVDKRYQDVGILTTHEASVAACQDMVEWADEHPRKGLVDIEKVCNFLSNIDIKKYISSLTDGVGFVNIHIGDIIEDMKKAVEG